MTVFELIIAFVQLLGLNVGMYYLIKAILLRRKTMAFLKEVNKTHRQNEQIRLRNDKAIDEIRERLNLLSKENVKLISKNEELKDRLRNLGIKDFDVIN